MSGLRAVSLVPSATEIALALGAGDRLLGVSDDCVHVPGAAGLPVVSRAALLETTASQAARDAAVRRTLAAGRSLYALDGDAIAALRPDVVFAQDDCAVCAVPSSLVLDQLGPEARATCRVVSIDPHDLEDVFASFEVVADALGLPGTGVELANACRDRLSAIGPAPGPPPRVLVLDWCDPPFVAGNWVPDLVEAAGGLPVGTKSGERSHGLDPSELKAGVDAVVVAPCGVPLSEATAAALELRQRLVELSVARWCVLDGRAFFSRPGPGLVEGTAAVAAWLAGDDLPDGVGRDLSAVRRPGDPR